MWIVELGLCYCWVFQKYFKVVSSWTKKEFELSQSCLAARAAARRSLQGGVCTTKEPPQPPPPAPWNIPCSQDDQLYPRQKLHPPSSTWTNREFTVPPKKDSHFLFAPLVPLPLSNLSHVRPSRCFVAAKEPALQTHSSLTPSPTPSCLLNKQ